MPTFTVTYTTDVTGTILQLTPSKQVINVGAFDKIEIVNSTGSEITIEAIPSTCSAFAKPGQLMHFKIKDQQSRDFDLRSDLAGAFQSPFDFLFLLWKAKGKNGATDITPLTPGSAINFQIAIQG